MAEEGHTLLLPGELCAKLSSLKLYIACIEAVRNFAHEQESKLNSKVEFQGPRTYWRSIIVMESQDNADLGVICLGSFIAHTKAEY